MILQYPVIYFVKNPPFRFGALLYLFNDLERV